MPPIPIPTPDANLRSSRRAFLYRAASCCGGSALLLAPFGLVGAASSLAEPPPDPAATPTRPDVAATDRDRILAAAERYLKLAPAPLTSLPCPRSPGTAHDYYSEAGPKADLADPTSPPPFTAHRDAVFTLGLAVPALAAAYALTGEERFAAHSALHLHAWFVDPATRMAPRLDYGQVAPAHEHNSPQGDPAAGPAPAPHPGGRFEGILETVPLVEIAIAIPFLAASSALSGNDLSMIHAWFQAYLRWLTEPQDSGPRLPALARDQKNHHATSWLLQASAYTLLSAPAGDAARAEDSALGELRHRFRAVTLRAQISHDGSFPHELPSPAPYRDSLFNLDMLAGICELLSTRFDSVWAYELEDGPGMRSAIAYHFPFIADRTLWPFRADVTHFDELPGRRASLLLTARAYQRPEYAALWKKLPPDPATLDILRTMPIHQPLLWVRQPARI